MQANLEGKKSNTLQLRNSSLGQHQGYRKRSYVSIPFLTFILIVLIPTISAIWFYGYFASDRYTSETRFIVRSLTSQHLTGLDAILKTFGLAAAQDDSFAISDYINSRDAVRGLSERLPLREIFGRQDADPLTRFPAPWSDGSEEELYKYYRSKVTVIRDSSSGVTSVQVVAFRAMDAKAIAEALLTLSEQLVNRMNERAQHDAVAGAVSEVEAAQRKVLSTQSDITSFRNKELIVDPNFTSSKMIDLIATLTSQLALADASIEEAKVNSPNGPAMASLNARTSALKMQIANERSKLTGSDQALASKLSVYERLVMAREFADRSLTSALGTLENARQDARRQHVYIEQVVSASNPDEPTEPLRLRGIVTVLFASFMAYTLSWVLLSGAKEHVHG